MKVGGDGNLVERRIIVMQPGPLHLFWTTGVFYFWALNNSLLELKLSKIGFKKKNKIVNNELVFLKKEIISDKNFFYMSDTDSFITLR